MLCVYLNSKLSVKSQASIEFHQQLMFHDLLRSQTLLISTNPSMAQVHKRGQLIRIEITPVKIA